MNEIKILIIEDDEIIAKSLKKSLEKWNYCVYLSSDFNRVIEEYLEISPHLIIMDIVLPYYSGYYWCSEIRKIANTPIVYISSKNSNMDIVMAMQLGGDDYIMKPFDMSVVIAKIQSLLRRSYSYVRDIQYSLFGEIQLNHKDASITYNNRSILLTRTEYQITEQLFQAEGGYVKREKIMEKCWHGDSYIDDNTLSVNLTRLRKKLLDLGLSEVIITKKGYGYALNKNYKSIDKGK